MNSSDLSHTFQTERGSHDYPTRDGRSFDSDVHREVVVETIEMLRRHFAGQQAYVSGNILTFYRRGDRRRFVSPDVMVVKGVEPGPRPNYLVWEEGRSPNVVIEITSARTRREDLKYKFDVYRQEMRVAEYFLFDPRGEYLSPRLCGFRLFGERYIAIEAIAGNLPSVELGLCLAAVGTSLRFLNPHNGQWLPTLARASTDAYFARLQAHAALENAEAARAAALAAFKRAQEEHDRLEQELEELRKQIAGPKLMGGESGDAGTQ
ncbi:MAG: Uma2 family endonuclease [Planctomycetaceae bacterium]|nr:Uma2 family endonuclease [Planctomycetaceae bacterium]